MNRYELPYRIRTDLLDNHGNDVYMGPGAVICQKADITFTDGTVLEGVEIREFTSFSIDKSLPSELWNFTITQQPRIRFSSIEDIVIL